MSNGDQDFLNFLSSVPRDILGYGEQVAEYIDQYSNVIAAELRDALESSSWIPDSVRPPATTRILHQSQSPPAGLLARTGDWLSRHRTAVAAVIAFAGTTAILIHIQRKSHTRKRRARRDRHGKKTEIVVLTGSSLLDPLTRSLALDLDRRGYIVYMTVSSAEEHGLVRAESKSDIQPLWMDLTSSVPNPAIDLHPNLEPLRQLIEPPSRNSSPGSTTSGRASSTQHHLAGLIVLPGSTGLTTGPFLTLPPADLVDTINTRLLSPMLTIQQFLPLLQLASTCNPPHSPSPPSLILAAPSIPTSLHLPNQTPEILSTTALSSLLDTLPHELPYPPRIRLTQLKLGHIDHTSSPAHPSPKAGEYVYSNPHPLANTPRNPNSSALTHWHSSQRPAPHSPPAHSTHTSPSRASSPRTFHNAVFDALNPSARSRSYAGTLVASSLGLGANGTGTVYVGSGARTYDLFARVVPRGLLGWLIRRRYGVGKPSPDGAMNRSGKGREEEKARGMPEDGKPDGEVPLPKWRTATGKRTGSSGSGEDSGSWQRV